MLQTRTTYLHCIPRAKQDQFVNKSEKVNDLNVLCLVFYQMNPVVSTVKLNIFNLNPVNIDRQSNLFNHFNQLQSTNILTWFRLICTATSSYSLPLSPPWEEQKLASLDDNGKRELKQQSRWVL